MRRKAENCEKVVNRLSGGQNYLRPQLEEFLIRNRRAAREHALFPRALSAIPARARGRLADCLFTLGTSEVARYQEALDAYQALYKRPAAAFDLRLQALYKMARCEAKLGLKEKSFAHYIEVVYSGTGQTEILSPEAAPWFTRAAFDAAAYQEQQQQWKEAVNIYKRIIQAGVPAKNEAQKRIEKIEREHASAL